jgi:hypothetical protein
MTRPDAAVVQALYGGYDTLKPVMPQEGPDVDWVLVTDDLSIRSGTLGWRVVHLPRPGVHPNRAAKGPKLFPWEHTSASASVWLDASFRVTSPDFVAEALAHTTVSDPVAQFVHPWRDCVYTEAEESAKLAKYAGEDFEPQVKDAREQGHPDHWGLWATGVIARRHDDDQVIDLGDVWADLIDRFTFQDQVSQPVALRVAGLRPVPLPGTHFANPWLTYEGSERH